MSESKSLNIALVSPDFPPGLSGLGDYVRELAKELIHSGHRVSVFTSTENVSRADQSEYNTRFVRGWSFFRSLRWLRELSRDQSKIISIQYIPHAYGRFGLAPGFVLALCIARFLWKPKLLVTVHEVFASWTVRPGMMLLSLLQRFQLRLLFIAASRVLVVTEGQRQLLGHYVRPSSPSIEILPVGPTVIPDALSKERSRELRQRLTADGEYLVGSLSLRPDRDDLNRQFHVASQLRKDGLNVRLVLLGKDQSQDIPSDHLKWTTVPGQLDSTELSAYLKSLDVFLHLRIEGPTTRNTSLINAMAHELPVVALPCFYAKETALWEGSGISIVENEADSLCDATRLLLTVDSNRNEAVRAGSEFFASHFSWSVIARQMVEIAKRL